MQHPRNPLNNQVQLGVLVIVVLRGRHLPDKHTTYKQSPYVKCRLSNEAEETVVDKNGGQHPCWDSELRFPVYADTSKRENRILSIEVWARESRLDDLLGIAEIDISSVLRNGEFDEWVPLKSQNGVERGQVYLEMTFFSMGFPPPSHLALQQRQQSLPVQTVGLSTIVEPELDTPTRSQSLPNPHLETPHKRRLRKPRRFPPPSSILVTTNPNVGLPAQPLVITESPSSAYSGLQGPQTHAPPTFSTSNFQMPMPLPTPPSMPGSLSVKPKATMKDLPPVPGEGDLLGSLTTALMEAGSKITSFTTFPSPTSDTSKACSKSSQVQEDWGTSLKSAVGSMGKGWMSWGTQAQK